MADRSIASLGVVQAVRLALGLFTAVLAARWLGPSAWGEIGLARGVAQVWWVLPTLGAMDLVTRQVAQDRTHGLRTLAVLLRRLPRAGVLSTLAIAGSLAAMGGSSRQIALGVAAGGVSTVAARLILDDSALLGGGHATKQVVPTLVARGIQALVLVAALAAGAGVWSVIAAWGTGEALLAVSLAHRRAVHVGPLPPADPEDQARTLQASTPFARNLLFGTLFAVGDVLVLGALRGPAEVGLYQAAAVLALQLPVVAQVVGRGLLPTLSVHPADEASSTITQVARPLWALSLPIAVGGIVLAEPLVLETLGPAYGGSVLPLVLLLPTVPLRFVQALLTTALTARRHEDARMRLARLAAGMNLGLNLLVVPAWGAAGAAATMLLTEGVVYTLAVRAQGRTDAAAPVHDAVPRVLLACAVMAAAVWAVPWLPVLARVAGGAAVYALAVVSLRAASIADLRRLLST